VGVWYQLFLREALLAVARHKTRSALATLGIAMGIAAVVLVVAVGQAGSERAEAALQGLGDNLVWVEAGSRNVAGTRTGTHGTNSLMLDDAEAIAREVPLITRMSPQIDGNVRLIWGNRNWSTRFRGESPAYLDIKRFTVSAGAPFTDEDVEQAASKILIGQTVRKQLFGPQDNPVGQLVRMQGQLFEVIGVLAEKGQSPDGRDQDDWVLLPYTTAHHKLRGPGPMWLDDILCSAASREAVNPAIDQIIALMRQRHHVEPGSEDDFNIRRPDEVLKAQVEASDTLALLLLCVGLIALLVGGIGIMNVMLATVTQRTREIGVRLAVGARPLDVLLQFLGEAVSLGIVGGLCGIVVSVAGSSLFEKLLGWPIALSARAVVVALASSVAVGICSGLYPANRAAGMDPVDALRHE
jgi:putative ABC transport system permease protein